MGGGIHQNQRAQHPGLAVGKGGNRLASIVDELYKRDRLPDLDKGTGAAPGTVVEAAVRYLSTR